MGRGWTPREGSLSSIRILILLRSATLGGTGATRVSAGSGAGQGGRCRGTRRGQRPARPYTGLEATAVLSVPAVTLRPACTWRHLSGRRRGSGVAQGCGPGPAERLLFPPLVPLPHPSPRTPPQGRATGEGPSPDPASGITSAPASSSAQPRHGREKPRAGRPAGTGGSRPH